MTDLSTTYMGLKLKNPLIAGSSGLTDDVTAIKDLEKNEAAAVVIKSIFEEEITLEYQQILNNESGASREEFLDYLDVRIKENKIQHYMDLIESVKKQVSIPVIASVNCSFSFEWAFFAKKMQEAGADALELNIFVLSSDPNKTSEDLENRYYKIVDKVSKELSIPMAVKLTPYFTGLANTTNKLVDMGVNGLVMFNRFFSPDFDINKMELITTDIYSSEKDYLNSLRWISLLSDKVKADFCASGGIHDGETAVKMLLAGASAVQVVSGLYKHGNVLIGKILKDIENWMRQNQFDKISDFQGKLSYKNADNPSLLERTQFMKYFSDKM